MSGHRLTAEQATIVDAYLQQRDLVIEAGAGAGKTSTLRACAEADGRRACYFAYNKAICEDARGSFPRHVECATAHSLAFRAVGRRYAHRLNGGRMPARDVARHLRIAGPLRIEVGPQQVVALDPVRLVRLAIAAVANFCQSGALELGPEHVPHVRRLETPAHHGALVDVVAPIARAIWADVTRVDGVLPFSHDCYLKLWQLQQPTIDADVVLLDEAQDANPAIAAIVNAQEHAQRVLVGDQQQQLYAWRGAVDAMRGFPGDRFLLSQSFRFGPAIADEANRWLALLGATLRIRGFERIESVVGDVAAPRAILTRTNAGAMAEAMALLTAGKRVALVGGDGQIRALAEAAVELQAGRQSWHPELIAFASWSALQEYVAEDEGSDLRALVKLVDTHGPQKLLEICNRFVAERDADVTISTAHRSKGREWASVRVASDFRAPKSDDLPKPDDLMLAYVTVTRAKQQLELGGLSWIDRYDADDADEGDDR